MITGTKLSLQYAHNGQLQYALDNVDFTIPAGRITAFVGKSGAGKTTLLRCCAQLTTNYEGSIELQGKSLSSYADKARVHRIGFVFQRFNLFPHMTALDNCTAPVLYEGSIKTETAIKKAHAVLRMVGMDAYASSYPHQLSGGQQQRIAIARALMFNPKVLLFDEPTSALDPESTCTFSQIVHTLLEQGISIAYASHDMQFIKATLDRVYLLKDGAVVETFDAKKQKMGDVPAVASFLSCSY